MYSTQTILNRIHGEELGRMFVFSANTLTVDFNDASHTVETKSPMTLMASWLTPSVTHISCIINQPGQSRNIGEVIYFLSIDKNIYRYIWRKLSMSCDGLFLFLFGFKHALLPAQMPSLLKLAASHNDSTAGHIGIFVLCFFHHYSGLYGVGRLLRREMHSWYHSS